MSGNNLTRKLVEELVRQGQFRSVERGCYHLERFFEGVPLKGRSVLEIGSGRGELCLYAACQGASRVVGLEPEVAGSRASSLQTFRQMIDVLGLSQVEGLPLALEEFEPGRETFDLVVSSDSINHLDEAACRNLRQSPEARARYLGILGIISALSRPGATLIVTDVSRHNLFKTLGLRNPMCPSINWELHQTPRFWASLLKECGFDEPRISWVQPWRLERFGVLTRNALLAYCFRSRFRLVMTKVAR